MINKLHCGLHVSNQVSDIGPMSLYLIANFICQTETTFINNLKGR